ncbi:MAG: MFS transporter, partial [Clostridia bacterium]|nr:MFS transporter [Clostridia bacterium]
MNFDYIKKQKLLILLCCMVYSLAYVGRYSYNANIGSIITYYGVTRADAGVVSTYFFFSYGVGQLVNAILCKRYPKRHVVAGALIASSAINAVLFILPPCSWIKYLWLLNGICQSILYPTLMLILGEVLEQKMMKRAVLAMSISVLLGTLLSYGGAALFNYVGSFRLSFFFGVVATAFIGVTWLIFYNVLTNERPAPIPQAELDKQLRLEKGTVATEMIGLLVIYALFAVADNFVKDGLNTWAPVILKEQFNFENSISIVLTLILPIFDVFGSVLAIQTNRILQ